MITEVDAESALSSLAAALRAGQGFEALTGLPRPAPGDELGRSTGQRAYRRLVKQCHPDLVSSEHTLAAEVFSQLTAAWEAWSRAEVVIRTRRGRYAVGGAQWAGEVCSAFQARELDTPEHAALELRLPHHPSSNDLMVAEARALRRLHDEVPEQRAYFPQLVEQIRHHDEHGVERRANIVRRPEGLYSLAQVIAAHPDGLDPRDAAWMWRRGLVALGAAHRAGMVHTSPWPEHIWIEPHEHGVVLEGWWYACEEGQPVVAALTSRLSAHPSEMLVTHAAGPGEDIYILSASMRELIGARMPRALEGFIRGCTLEASRRPQDAWAVLAELDELLERMWGRRRFRPFVMPEVSA